MKKKVVIAASLLLLIVSVFIGKNYLDSKVRADIYNNTKKYHELLITAVNNFNENGTVDEDLFKNGYRFCNKYILPIKTTKKEDELIGFLRSEVGYYGNMLYGKSIGYSDFNIEISNFKKFSIKLTSYFKNNIR